ncbi:MAG TPA: hypothetical protein VMI13_04835 [Solirubrobacteraceae bacterium]|nr:hypothetical protein [Solirubrobacteraceae bacterium]
MVPLAVSGSGLLVITVAITVALVLLYVLLRGERDYAREAKEREAREHAEDHQGHADGPPPPQQPG